MFDTIGREREQDRGRQAKSIFVSILVNGGFLGGLIWAGSSVADEVLDDLPIEVTFFDAAPPPPPPPPPPAGGKKAKKKTEKKPEEKPEEPEPDPVEVEPDPVELPEEEPEEEPEVETEEEGVEGGQEGGVEGGTVGGVVGGQIGGVLGGQLGGDIRSVHWSEVRIRSKVPPRMPEAAKALGLESRCLIRFFIDEKGKPYDIKVEKCPKVYHENVLKAAWKWKFYPMRVEGKPARAQFVQPIRFKFTN
jgi:protein TonB